MRLEDARTASIVSYMTGATVGSGASVFAIGFEPLERGTLNLTEEKKSWLEFFSAA